jgi:hypothetical protein
MQGAEFRPERRVESRKQERIGSPRSGGKANMVV